MTWPTILADAPLTKQQIFQHVQTRFSEPEPGLSWKIPLVFGLLFIAVVLAWVLMRIERRQTESFGKPKPMRLYLHCLRQLHIGWWNTWHLWRLARRLRLSHPTALLISAPLYDAAVARYCQEANPLMVTLVRGRLIHLRRTLFSPHNQESAPLT